jgi:putative ATP-dependent DNA ligase
MLPRIVREGFQTVEWDENEAEFKKRYMQLGESILRPLRESIQSVKNGQRLYEEVRIRVKDPKLQQNSRITSKGLSGCYL